MNAWHLFFWPSISYNLSVLYGLHEKKKFWSNYKRAELLNTFIESLEFPSKDITKQKLNS